MLQLWKCTRVIDQDDFPEEVLWGAIDNAHNIAKKGGERLVVKDDYDAYCWQIVRIRDDLACVGSIVREGAIKWNGVAEGQIKAILIDDFL